jgi:hypothetical protein
MILFELFDFKFRIFKISKIHISIMGGAGGVWLSPKLILNQALSIMSIIQDQKFLRHSHKNIELRPRKFHKSV